MLDKESGVGKIVWALIELASKRQQAINSLKKEHDKELLEAAGIVADYFTKLQRHRKPSRNSEQDAEIMRLHQDDKSAGKIRLALRQQFGEMTDIAIRFVILRESKKQANSAIVSY